nr:uncharacterized protein LOC109753121 [Aegilops tauschii subsp. strangulata]
MADSKTSSVGAEEMCDDDDRIPECDYCGDDQGLFDRPHLVDGRCFSVKLDETIDVEMCEGTTGAPKATPGRKKQLFSQDHIETKRVPIDDDNLVPTFTIGAGLPSDQERALVRFLRANKDAFACKAFDLVGVPREVIEHHLAVCPNARLVKQKIKMAAEDVENTAFISACGVYCYTCMPLRLRSTGATFQRLMHIALGPQLGINAEAYIDDIMVKSRKATTLIEDLEETFGNLRRVNLRLNPEKCVFGSHLASFSVSLSRTEE